MKKSLEWLLKLEAGQIPSLEDIPSLCATVSKAGDFFFAAGDGAGGQDGE